MKHSHSPSNKYSSYRSRKDWKKQKDQQAFNKIEFWLRSVLKNYGALGENKKKAVKGSDEHASMALEVFSEILKDEKWSLKFGYDAQTLAFILGQEALFLESPAQLKALWSEPSQRVQLTSNPELNFGWMLQFIMPSKGLSPKKEHLSQLKAFTLGLRIAKGTALTREVHAVLEKSVLNEDIVEARSWIEHGISVDPSKNNSLLSIAFDKRNKPLMDVLLGHGANPLLCSRINPWNQTVLDHLPGMGLLWVQHCVGLALPMTLFDEAKRMEEEARDNHYLGLGRVAASTALKSDLLQAFESQLQKAWNTLVTKHEDPEVRIKAEKWVLELALESGQPISPDKRPISVRKKVL